ncbi:uncharacterized protein LOC102547047 isoform X2 [Rattus norvegicus]|uniref:uncharacterized protein LOC102547047 isoform X2 n=1 Tax=Rattus norvegicus TaxID=10116 RepID=UPI0003D0977E|nr:uncharacterized protein LOC102547047 isoform X1 [Rattus norvegicus]|eukprot:XP_006247278.1 PREDICTED: uncharacterized protein LOC102547047 isoform X1 [Rattus norvegicus]
MAGILVRVERDLPDKETDDRRASDVLPRLGLSRAESSYHTRRRSWGVTQLAAVSAHGPWRRLEIEQSQPVSGEQSAAPTRSSAETAADAGVARGPGGAHQGCHGPGPAARAAASRGVPVMASKGGRMLSLACPRRALDPWRGPSSLGQRHRPAPVTPRKAPGLSRARQGPTPSRVHCGCQSAGVWSWMGRGPGPLSPAPPTAEVCLLMSVTTYCGTYMKTPRHLINYELATRRACIEGWRDPRTQQPQLQSSAQNWVCSKGFLEAGLFSCLKRIGRGMLDPGILSRGTQSLRLDQFIVSR